MAVEFKCDLCGKKMVSVARTKVKDYMQEHGADVCGDCSKKVTELDKRLESFKIHWDSEFNRMKQSAKDALMKEIGKIATGV